MIRLLSLSMLFSALVAVAFAAPASAQSPHIRYETFKKFPGATLVPKGYDLGVMKLDVRQALRMESDGSRRMVVFVQPWITNVGTTASPAGTFVKITARLPNGFVADLGPFAIPAVQPGKQILPVFQPNGSNPEYYRGALFEVELTLKDANNFNNSLQYQNFQP